MTQRQRERVYEAIHAAEEVIRRLADVGCKVWEGNTNHPCWCAARRLRDAVRKLRQSVSQPSIQSARFRHEEIEKLDDLAREAKG